MYFIFNVKIFFLFQIIVQRLLPDLTMEDGVQAASDNMSVWESCLETIITLAVSFGAHIVPKKINTLLPKAPFTPPVTMLLCVPVSFNEVVKRRS